MSQASVITEEMLAAIGVESEPLVFEVEKGGCRLFARAVGYSDPIYYDEDFAKGQGYRSLVAPPGFLGQPLFGPGQLNPVLASYLRFQTPYKRILNGGNDIEYFDTVCAGDVLTATSKLVDIRERVGSLGPMLITVTEWTFRNPQGKIIAIARNTGIRY